MDAMVVELSRFDNIVQSPVCTHRVAVILAVRGCKSVIGLDGVSLKEALFGRVKLIKFPGAVNKADMGRKVLAKDRMNMLLGLIMKVRPNAPVEPSARSSASSNRVTALTAVLISLIGHAGGIDSGVSDFEPSDY